MGACSSCLGHTKDHDLSDEDEQSRLLFDDHPSNHYGSMGDSNSGALHVDPQEVQRENEALLKVVTQTSNHLVDIFAMALQAVPPTAPSVFPTQDVRLLRYQEVLAKLSTSESLSGSDEVPVEDVANPSEGWMSEDDDIEEVKGHTPVKSEGIGRLLGGFADADSSLN